jgi:hypothetical protein
MNPNKVCGSKSIKKSFGSTTMPENVLVHKTLKVGVTNLGIGMQENFSSLVQTTVKNFNIKNCQLSHFKNFTKSKFVVLTFLNDCLLKH